MQTFINGKASYKKHVCPRCILAVQQILGKFQFNYKNVNLGEVGFYESLSVEQKDLFEKEIKAIGFELIDDRKSRMIEKIKSIIIQKIHPEKDMDQIGENIEELRTLVNSEMWKMIYRVLK